jgi:hypothetical protein
LRTVDADLRKESIKLANESVKIYQAMVTADKERNEFLTFKKNLKKKLFDAETKKRTDALINGTVFDTTNWDQYSTELQEVETEIKSMAISSRENKKNLT